MAKKYPGFYLYYDWLDAMEHLPAKKAMTIIKNLSDYARYGVEPPPVEGHAGSLQTIFAAQLKRSMVNAENGRLGGAAGQKKASATKENPPPESGAAVPRALRAEEIQAIGFLDYLKIKARFDAEERESRRQSGEALPAPGSEGKVSLRANPSPREEALAEPLAAAEASPTGGSAEEPSEEPPVEPSAESSVGPSVGTSVGPWEAPWEEDPFLPI